MSTWIVLVATGVARLIEVTTAPLGRSHVVRHEVLEAAAVEADDDPQRLAPRLSRSGGAAMDQRRLALERRRRFVRRLIDWLPRRVHQHGIEHATVFCVPTLIGHLRRELDDDTAARLRWDARDLMLLSDSALLEHAAVVEALELAHPD